MKLNSRVFLVSYWTFEIVFYLCFHWWEHVDFPDFFELSVFSKSGIGDVEGESDNG